MASGFNNAASRAGGLLAVAALPLLVGLSGSGYAQPAALTGAYRGAMLWCAGLLLAGAAMAALLIHRPPKRSGRAPCRSRVPFLASQARARLTALVTAFTEAVTMLASVPTPQTVRPSTSHST